MLYIVKRGFGRRTDGNWHRERKGNTMRATWNGAVVAESEDTIVVEGNHYFPPDAVNRAYLRPSETHSVCHWKGTASYYDLDVDGQVNHDAVWYYPEPSDAAKQITGYVAFWKGVRVEPSPELATDTAR